MTLLWLIEGERGGAVLREVLRGCVGLGGEAVGSHLGVDESSFKVGRVVGALRVSRSIVFANFHPAFCAAPRGPRF